MAVASCSTDDSKQKDSIVSSFDVVQSVKSASKSYEIKMDGETYFLTLSTSLQWPEQFGDMNIKALQDTLRRSVLNDTVAVPVDEAMAKWVNEVDPDMFAGATVTAVDSVPGVSIYNFEMESTGKMIEFNEKTVTYEVMKYAYTGGAHGNTSSYPFTYDLQRGVVLTYDNMFKAGSKAKLLAAITEELATQYNTTPDRLASIGIAAPLEVVGDPFIEDGYVVFRYNPYAIAPYVFGTIDVRVIPGSIAAQLTPEVASLLEVGDLD